MKKTYHKKNFGSIFWAFTVIKDEMMRSGQGVGRQIAKQDSSKPLAEGRTTLVVHSSLFLHKFGLRITLINSISYNEPILRRVIKKV